MELLILGIGIGLAVGLLIGLRLGSAMTRGNFIRNNLGRLRIDHSIPDEPAMMFVELNRVTPDMIAQLKFVTFEVINESYLSHD